MTVDKAGSVVERVQPNEIDHGQHDAVRDVFVAPVVHPGPGDLFDELGGSIRPSWPWRGPRPVLEAQVVGPGSSWRPMPGSATRGAGLRRRPIAPTLAPATAPVTSTPRHPPGAPTTARAAGRAEVLRPFHLVRVLPQVAVLAFAESSWPRRPATAPGPAWCGLAVEPRPAEDRPGAAQGAEGPPAPPDKEIRLLQIGGSARLATYGRRVFQYGFHGAHADELAAPTRVRPPPRRRPGRRRRRVVERPGQQAVRTWSGRRRRHPPHRCRASSGPPARHRTVHPFPVGPPCGPSSSADGIPPGGDDAPPRPRWPSSAESARCWWGPWD